MSSYKGTRIAIINSEGKYLMQFRDGSPKNPRPLRWNFFGGTADGDESPIEGALRELSEELGLRVKQNDLTEVAVKDKEYLFRLRKPLSWDDFRIQEGAGAAFLSKDELLQLPLDESTKAFVTLYL